MRRSLHTWDRRRSGFTLVELLVTLGMIALLVSLLMPAVSAARRQALAVRCAANLRSVGQALVMYTQRYQHYPSCSLAESGTGSSAVWPVRLRLFTGGDQGVFHCPARDERCEWKKGPAAPGQRAATDVHARYGYEVGERLLEIHGRVPFSYGYNIHGTRFNGAGEPPSEAHKGLGQYISAVPSITPMLRVTELHASRVRSPAEMIAITDSNLDAPEHFYVMPNSWSPSVRPGTIHKGGANVLFCDGHVQWYLQTDLNVTHARNVPAEAAIRRMWNNDNRPNWDN